MTLRVKNWEKYQHYKERNPPWIKLHQSLLDDHSFYCLQDASKLHLILIWLYASKHNGEVPVDSTFLARKIGVTGPINLQVLVDTGFLIDASGALARCLQGACLETETYKEETETEESLEHPPAASARVRVPRKRSTGGAKAEADPEFMSGFNRIWSEYPRKLGKAKSIGYLWSVYQSEGVAGMQAALNATVYYAAAQRGTEPRFIKHGSAFFNSFWRDWVNGDPDRKLKLAAPL